MLADSVFLQIVVGDVIGRQIAVIAFALGRAGHLPQFRERPQRGFDFPQLNAKSAQLDLRVIAAKKLDGPIRQIAAQIAGEIHQGIGRTAEGIENEPLHRQVIAVEITPRQSLAANADFPDCSLRNGLAITVEQIEPVTRQRLADNAGIGAGQDLPERGHHRGFGRAIQAEQPGLARPPVGGRFVDDIAAKGDHPQRRQRFPRQVLQHHRGQHRMRHALFAQGPMQRRRVLAGCFRDNRQGSSGQQG